MTGGDLVGGDAEAVGDEAVHELGGKKRSSVHNTNLVGTSGHAASSHGLCPGVADWARVLRRACPARARGTSW
jgi:hypothetical protein